MRPIQRRLAKEGFTGEFFSYRTTSASIAKHAAQFRRFLDARPNAHVVAHSLGCLVTLASGGCVAPRRAVLLGPPLQGSFVARRVSRLGLGGLLFRQIGSDLHRGYPRGVHDGVGVIAGSRRVGMGSLMGGMARPGDGTVSLEETRVHGLQHHLVLPVSHSSMLFSRAVAAQTVAFLRDGRFDRAVIN